VSVALLVACGDSDDNPASGGSDGGTTPQGAQATTAAAAPREGGTLALVNSDDPLSFDLHQEQQTVTQSAWAPMYNQLIKRDAIDQTKLVPDLAASWESPEPTSYVFKFPTGVTWHDGSPFTAEDAAFSLQRIKTPPQNQPSPWKAFIDPVDKVQVIDPSTLQIDLSYPSVPLLSYFAIGWIVILQKQMIATKGDAKRDAIGTGPFKFKNLSTGSVIELTKNPNYFKKDLPYVDGITNYIIKDPEARMSQFLGKRVFISDVEVEDRDRVKGRDITLNALPNNSGFALWMNVRTGPFTDARVRKAVDLILDREEAIKLISDGVGEIGGLFIPGSGWGMTADQVRQLPGFRTPKEQDHAEARRLLEAAGVRSGFTFTMTFRSTAADWERMAIFARSQLAPFDITANIAKVDVATETTLRRQGAIEAFPSIVFHQDLDPDSLLTPYFRPGAARNFTNVDDPQLVSLVDAQAREQNETKRKEIVLQAEQRVRENVLMAQLHWPQRFSAYWNHVQGYKPSILLNSHRQMEGVWLKS
jgi:peptide/nickel transport system substrate-binding protein